MIVWLIVAPVGLGFVLAALLIMGHMLFADQLAEQGKRCPLRGEEAQPVRVRITPNR